MSPSSRKGFTCQRKNHLCFTKTMHQSTSQWKSDLKKILQGKKFGSDDEVIAATEAHFGAKDKSFYKKGIISIEKTFEWLCCHRRWLIDHVDEESRTLPKKCVLQVSSWLSHVKILFKNILGKVWNFFSNIIGCKLFGVNIFNWGKHILTKLWNLLVLNKCT